jgi:phosphomannomutase
VSDVRDLAPGGEGLPPSDVLIWQLGEAGRVVLRPSGTEPKLKAYLEATAAPCRPGELSAARRTARARLDDLRQEVARTVEEAA